MPVCFVCLEEQLATPVPWSKRVSMCTCVSVSKLLAGGMGSRLDHTLSSLITLHKWPHLQLVLWGDGNMAQLLTPGKHTIRPAKGFEGPCCALVPLNGPATLTSSGLKWNLGIAAAC